VDELAPGVWQLRGRPRHLINVYLLGDVLIDAATKRSGRRILRELRGSRLSAHALTHAHPDHQGASKLVCETLGVPFWVGEADAAMAEDPRLIKQSQPANLLNRINWRLYTGPGHPVDRRLRKGDEVAGFEVLDAPGHSPGHVAFWREPDRVLILGDVLNNMNVITGLPTGLQEPPKIYTPDPARNRESARRLAALEPALTCFGHGPPLRDTKKLVDFVDGLPS
jgi:glyoxylase-like metal-dependent hydrolase (beta-lactamase superfamily II)